MNLLLIWDDGSFKWLICDLTHQKFTRGPESKLRCRISINLEVQNGALEFHFLFLLKLWKAAAPVDFTIRFVLCIFNPFDDYSERIYILCSEWIRKRDLYCIALCICLFTGLYLVGASAFIKCNKRGKSSLAFFISFKIDFLTFFVFWYWKSVASWFSLK